MITSINTYYNGNYHRSRLEARWAVFFKELGVKYEYEPEGFVNERGDCYLPDFYLPDTYLRGWRGKGVYVEIKPESYESEDIVQSDWFEKNLVLFKGTPDLNIWGAWGRKDKNCYGGFECGDSWDHCMFFWICDKCNTSKIEHSEMNYDYCPECKGQCIGDKLEISSKVALLKRFEFQHNARL